MTISGFLKGVLGAAAVIFIFVTGASLGFTLGEYTGRAETIYSFMAAEMMGGGGASPDEQHP